MLIDYLLRLVLAGICGAAIGYERKNRMKEAGIRTHFIVGIGAALMMLVSKYGFQDEVGIGGIALDPSRIAAQVVSGVSFLGAGMIFLQRQTVKGLTTAAGIWATAGMGLAIGAGLYGLGLGVTVIILIGQTLLHRSYPWLTMPKTEQLILRVANVPGVLDEVERHLAALDIGIVRSQAEKSEGQGDIELNYQVKLPGAFNKQQLLRLVQEHPNVLAVEVQ